MKKYIKLIIPVFIIICISILFYYLAHGKNIAVLNPKGTIASSQRELIIIGILLSALVVIPVYILTIAIVLKYRADNKKAKYDPDWDHNSKIEFTWWAIPVVIILILSVITWISSHDLDPYKSLNSSKTPITIQVISLDWKWLFIYPQERIATINYFKVPVNTPINFEITSDTVMNSFWIPNLGGQIYAMPGMSTQLHLIAAQVGNYPGSSANISGKGFAGMTFTAQAVTPADFNDWISSVTTKNSSIYILDSNLYSNLTKPSINNKASTYLLGDENIYNDVVMKYMMPMNTENTSINSKVSTNTTNNTNNNSSTNMNMNTNMKGMQ